MADLLEHPVTGEKGVWRYMAGLGWVNVDPNKITQTTTGPSFSDIYDPPADPVPAEPTNEYMTDAELAIYNAENGTSFSGLHLRYHPETGEAGIWTWDPMAGWRDDSKWLGPRTEYADGTPITGVGAFADVYKDKAEAAGVDTTPRQVIGWYWDGTNWQPIYQGDSAPDGAVVAPTSTMPSGPPQNSNGGSNNTASNNNNPSSDPVITGWYYALQGGVEQWIPVYEGYNPLAGAPYVAGSAMPTAPPEGYGNNSSTTSNSTTSSTTTTPDNTASNTTTTPTPEPPELFTPDKSMFYQGLYTAADLLRRDGGEINSPFYNNARQQVLDSLAAQATAAGRTQNTAEEIAMARGSTPTLTASGLFDPKFYSLVDELGI